MNINATRWPRDPDWTCPNKVDECPSAEWCRTHFHFRNFGLLTIKHTCSCPVVHTCGATQVSPN